MIEDVKRGPLRSPGRKIQALLTLQKLVSEVAGRSSFLKEQEVSRSSLKGPWSLGREKSVVS